MFERLELKVSNNDCLVTPLEVITLRNMGTGVFTLVHKFIGAN